MAALILEIWRGGVRALLCAFCGLGVLIAILIPPFQVPDEPVHWTAANSRTTLSRQADNPDVACSLANQLPHVFEVGRIAFRDTEKISGRQFRNIDLMKPACGQSALNYGIITTYPGILAARAITTGDSTFGHKAFQVFIFSRIFQGAFLLLVAWRLVSLSLSTNRIVPGLLVSLTMMVSPLFLQQSFSLSADVVTFALPLSLLLFMFHLINVRWFDWAVLFAISITVCATKPTLFAIIPVFLYAGLLRSKQEGQYPTWPVCMRSSEAWLMHLCVFMSLCAALWISLAQPINAAGTSPVNGSIKGQIAHIVQHPLGSFLLLVNTTWAYCSSWGPYLGSLGWLDTHLSGWTQKRYQHLLTLAAIVDLLICLITWIRGGAQRNHLRALQWKIPLNSIVAVSLFAAGLCTSLIIYLSWSPVGAASISGLQPRYFLPFLLPVPVLLGDLLSGGQIKLEGDNKKSVPGSLLGYVLFGVASLLFFCPLYLDLILRWW